MNVSITQGEATLDNIIRTYLFEKGYNSLHKYARCLVYAFEALTEYKWASAEQIKTITLTLNANKTADFPTDLIHWTRLGYKRGDRYQIFINDKYLSLHTTDDSTPNLPFEYTAIGAMDTGDDNAGIYTFDAGGVEDYHNQAFRIDRTKKQFMFGGRIKSSTTIYLEYIAHGYSSSTETYVPVNAVPFIKAYIDFCWAKKRYGLNSVETQMSKRAWQDELIVDTLRTNGLNIREIINSSMRRQEPFFRRMFG